MSPFGSKHPISETSWRRGAAVAFLVLVVTFGVLLERAEDQTDKVDKRVAKVESPCLKYGAKSRQCEKAFEAAVSTITHPQACAIERKAGTLRAIRELADAVNVTFTEPCAGARLAQERQRGNEREATARENGSHEGGAPASSGSGEAPTPGKGDSGKPAAPPKPDGPRHHPTKAPPKGGGGATDGASQPNASSVPNQSPAAPVLNPAGKEVPVDPPGLLEETGAALGTTLDKAGGVVEKAGGAVNEAGCTVTGRC